MHGDPSEGQVVHFVPFFVSAVLKRVTKEGNGHDEARIYIVNVERVMKKLGPASDKLIDAAKKFLSFCRKTFSR